MSLVVCIKDKNRFILGADRQSSIGDSKSHLSTKIWEVEELPGAIMGSVGMARGSQVIQYAQLFDKNELPQFIDTSYIVNYLTKVIVAALKESGVRCFPATDADDNGSLYLPNAYFFAYENHAWMIHNDLSVVEIEDYLAIGSGSDVANGALFATKSKNPFERIVTCIDAAAETTLYVDHAVDFLATDYLASDVKLITKALNLPDVEEEKPKKKKKGAKK